MRPTHAGYCNCPSCYDRLYPDNPLLEDKREEDEAIARKIRNDIEQAQAERLREFYARIGNLLGLEES